MAWPLAVLAGSRWKRVPLQDRFESPPISPRNWSRKSRTKQNNSDWKCGKQVRFNKNRWKADGRQERLKILPSWLHRFNFHARFQAFTNYTGSAIKWTAQPKQRKRSNHSSLSRNQRPRITSQGTPCSLSNLPRDRCTLQTQEWMGNWIEVWRQLLRYQSPLEPDNNKGRVNWKLPLPTKSSQ